MRPYLFTGVHKHNKPAFNASKSFIGANNKLLPASNMSLEVFKSRTTAVPQHQNDSLPQSNISLGNKTNPTDKSVTISNGSDINMIQELIIANVTKLISTPRRLNRTLIEEFRWVNSLVFVVFSFYHLVFYFIFRVYYLRYTYIHCPMYTVCNWKKNI